MMELYLDRLGYAITVADTAVKAWAEVAAAPEEFDVVVVDATMIRWDLPDLIQKMLAASPRLCVLVASGYPVDMSALRESAGPRAAFLQKPFGPDDLVTAIRRILGAQKEEGL
jgi:DNA-binding NtrC family response regulator